VCHGQDFSVFNPFPSSVRVNSFIDAVLKAVVRVVSIGEERVETIVTSRDLITDAFRTRMHQKYS
jgi:hypothetical protein